MFLKTSSSFMQAPDAFFPIDDFISLCMLESYFAMCYSHIIALSPLSPPQYAGQSFAHGFDSQFGSTAHGASWLTQADRNHNESRGSDATEDGHEDSYSAAAGVSRTSHGTSNWSMF